MDSEGINGGEVKPPQSGFCAETTVCEPDGPLWKARQRVAGYLRGCFKRGAKYMLWDAGKFARATNSKNPLSRKHVERVFPIFRKLTRGFQFELVRVGRSHRWRVTVAGAPYSAPAPLDPAEMLKRRLVAYISSAVKSQKFAFINRSFIGCFCKATGYTFDAAQAAFLALDQIGKFTMSRIRDGVDFLVRFSLNSPPHFSRGVCSSPVGEERRIEKQTTRAGAPFEIFSRWISEKRLHGLACHLAKGPMRDEHYDGLKVVWRFAHARNLALAALRAGFSAAQIVGAYRVGLRASHADATDSGEFTPRQPSAAVVYARRALLADGKTAETRWADFLGGPDAREARAAEAVETKARRSEASRARAETPSRHFQAPPPVPSPVFHKAPEIAPETLSRLLPQWLKERGMQFAEFAGMPFDFQRSLLSRLLTEKGFAPL